MAETHILENVAVSVFSSVSFGGDYALKMAGNCDSLGEKCGNYSLLNASKGLFHRGSTAEEWIAPVWSGCFPQEAVKKKTGADVDSGVDFDQRVDDAVLYHGIYFCNIPSM